MKGYNMSDFEIERKTVIEIADDKKISETDISEKIISIVQNAVNAFELFYSEYMRFIDNDETNTDKILKCLNNVRIYKKIISLSNNIINENSIQPNSDKVDDFSENNFKEQINCIQVSINEIRKKYQKIFNDSVDIEDEEEYQRVQRETRQKIKAYKALNEFCTELYKIIENHIPIKFTANQSTEDIQEEKIIDIVTLPELPTEQVFTDSNLGIVNLNIPDFYTGFKPISFTYDNKKYIVSNWKKVYTKFIGILYGDSNFTRILRSYIGKSVSSKTHNHPDFADKKLSEIMRVPFKVENDFFIETNFSTSDIIRKIKGVMLMCNISTESLIIEYDVPKKYKNAEKENTSDEAIQTESVAENPASVHEEVEKSDIEHCIVDILKNNENNIYYQDGFSSYTVKKLLPSEYADTVTTDEIENVLGTNEYIKEIESNYYVYDRNAEKSLPKTSVKTESVSVEEIAVEITEDLSEQKTVSVGNRNITLVMNNRSYMVYDYADALVKICEFVIRLKSFRMAHIAKSDIKLKGIPVFYRNPVPVADYKKLSNGLQLVPVKSFDDVDEITQKLVDYCCIDRNMIILKDE